MRDKLLETFPDLEPDDIKSTVMGDSGEDIQLSPLARKIIPLTIEVKRRKNNLKTVYDYMEQASSHAKESLLCSIVLTGSLGLLWLGWNTT